MILWTQFLILVVIISVAGYFLSVYGDQVAELSGLGKSWIGATLIAMVTSLPELGSGISAVTIANAPDLAVADIFGSCAFNLSILFMIDILSRKKSMFDAANESHIITSIMGLTLIGLACFALILNIIGIDITLGHIGLSSCLLMITYFVFMKILYTAETSQYDPNHRRDSKKLSRAIIKFTCSALVVIGCGLYLPVLGNKIVIAMDWNQAFFGTLFLAFATSLPEMIVTISAFSIGSIDLAIGNVLGSNLFNIAILFIDDVFYKIGPIFSQVNPIHSITGLLAILMTSMALLGFVLKPKKQILMYMSWPTLIIAVCYGFVMIILYHAG
ncbi:MAG: hypothetical protein KDD46_02125 [Bdellovibrionales bacterium]|nr:hypothetical protein [Bdellovibrionales bacterium]